MKRIRVIPVLLIKNGGLVKSVKFKNHNYIGDPINAVKIFNEKEVDEIVILDIDASKHNREPNIQIIEEIASEAFMPVAYGGGITTVDQVKAIIYAGAEKVIINTSALKNPELIGQSARIAGNQSIVVSVDVKKNLFGKYRVYSETVNSASKIDLFEYLKKMENLGAGEIFINSVDLDGTYKGYDIELLRQSSELLDIPVIACGGARNIEDFRMAVSEGKASAVAAGSMFVYHGNLKAVLINYPEQQRLIEKFYSKI
jgi:cyclase